MFKALYKVVDKKLGIKEILRYGSVGLVGALTDLSLLNVMVKFSNLDIYHAVVIAFLISVVVSYVLHCNWTFCVPQGATRLMVYAFTSIFGLILNIIIMYFLMEHLGWWYNYAKVSAMFIVVIWNYFVSRSLIFRKTHNVKTI